MSRRVLGCAVRSSFQFAAPHVERAFDAELALVAVEFGQGNDRIAIDDEFVIR